VCLGSGTIDEKSEKPIYKVIDANDAYLEEELGHGLTG
jgi:hypothetical protein